MSSDRWYPLSVAAGRVALKALDVRLRIEGEQHIPAAGPALIAATHVSYVDFIKLAETARRRGRQVRFFARHDLWHPPGLSRPMTSMRHIPVDRAAPAGAFLAARRLLRDGELVGNFPEAGISYSFTVRSMMRGTSALARDTGVPVIPIALWGGQRIYSVGRPRMGKVNRRDFTRGRRLDVLCGPPMSYDAGADLDSWTRRLGSVLTGLLEELQGRPEHRPVAGEYAPWYPAHLGGHAPTRREAERLEVVPRAALRPDWGPMSDDG